MGTASTSFPPLPGKLPPSPSQPHRTTTCSRLSCPGEAPPCLWPPPPAAQHASRLSTLPTCRKQGAAPKRTRKAKTFKLLNQIYRVIHLICTYLQKRSFARRGPGPTGGQRPEPTDAGSREGRVCVKALVASSDAAPVPGRAEQPGRALPETQLKDLYGPRRRRARTAPKGLPASRPGSAVGPCEDLKPHWPPQVPPTATGRAIQHRSHREPRATPTTTGHTDRHGPHRRPRPHQQPWVVPPNATDHTDRHRSHRRPRPHQRPRATPSATGHAHSQGSHWLFGLEPLRTPMRNNKEDSVNSAPPLVTDNPVGTDTLALSCHSARATHRNVTKIASIREYSVVLRRTVTE